jgi:hypothetical protein
VGVVLALGAVGYYSWAQRKTTKPQPEVIGRPVITINKAKSLEIPEIYSVEPEEKVPLVEEESKPVQRIYGGRYLKPLKPYDPTLANNEKTTEDFRAELDEKQKKLRNL